MQSSNAIWTPPQAAYLHIPFCRRRCFYCDFPIQVVGDKRRTADTASESYVELLLREIRASPAEGRPLTSIYFGGGTPSLLPPRLLAQLLSALRERYGFAPGAELLVFRVFTSQQVRARRDTRVCVFSARFYA